MSTKTIKQRIAVVAVSALTAGILSVVAAPAASALPNVAPGTTSPNGAITVMNIATTNPVAGAAVITNTNGAPASVGLVATGDIAGGRVAGTTQTAVLLKTGTLVVYSLGSATTGNAEYSVTYTVENGTITGLTGGDGVNASRTTGTCVAEATNCVASIVPTAGASTMTVRMYNRAMVTDAATTATTVLAVPASGTLNGQVTVTLADTSVSGTMSPSNSSLYYVDAAASGTDNAQTADATSNAGSLNTGSLGCINVQLNDGYSQDITSTTGLLTASATNNAVLAFAASNCAAGTTAGSAFYTSSPADAVLSVAQPVAGVALTTTVTLSYNGVVVGTKSFTFRGKVAKMTVTKTGIGALNGTSADNGYIKFEDAVGNTIFPTSSSTVYPLNSSTLSITASTATSSTSTAGISTTVPNSTTGETGRIAWSCGAADSNSNISLTWVNTDGSVVISNAFPAACAGNPTTYAASFDKAVYAPGEVATLSVTFTSPRGNRSNDFTAFTSGSPTTGSITVGSALTAVAAVANADRTTNGVKKYTYSVGNTEGAFNAIVSFPDLTLADAVTVPFTVKASSSTVTNAEVLKSIVSLIASINKQIQALQKLILRR